MVHAPNRMLNWLPKDRLIVWYISFDCHSLSYLLEVFEKIMRFKWPPHRNCLLIIVKNHYLLNKSIRKMIILFLVFFWRQEIYLCKSANSDWFYKSSVSLKCFHVDWISNLLKGTVTYCTEAVLQNYRVITVNRTLSLIQWIEAHYKGWLSSKNHIFESACQVDGKFEKFIRSQ